MSFKFDFELEDELDDEFAPLGQDSSLPVPPITPLRDIQEDVPEAGPSKPRLEPHRQHTLDELLAHLPESISFSPVPLPESFLGSPLLRRDLYDARFQLAASTLSEADGSSGGDEGERYVDTSSDLLPGIYEGGLKTWEGGMDLVDVLAGSGVDIRGKRVLEVGCGTALPSAYLLRSVLSGQPSDLREKTTIHVQDYNHLVLSLVSLPNLVLAVLPYLPADRLQRCLSDEEADSAPLGTEPAGVHTISEEDEDEDEDDGNNGNSDPVNRDAVSTPRLDRPGNLALTSELLHAVKELFERNNVELIFSSGDWSGLASSLQSSTTAAYDLIMTAETIYSEDSVPALLSVLRAALPLPQLSTARPGTANLEDSLGDLRVGQSWTSRVERGQGVVLLAAKVLYFGLSGGLQAFLARVDGDGGWSEIVKEWTRGVGRRVVQIGW